MASRYLGECWPCKVATWYITASYRVACARACVRGRCSFVRAGHLRHPREDLATIGKCVRWLKFQFLEIFLDVGFVEVLYPVDFNTLLA